MYVFVMYHSTTDSVDDKLMTIFRIFPSTQSMTFMQSLSLEDNLQELPNSVSENIFLENRFDRQATFSRKTKKIFQNVVC